MSEWLASWPEFAADAPHATSPAAAGDDRIVVLTGIDTKGLEFDGIIVVDPDAIEAESPTGRATLYVVLTRATQLLTLVR
jgi:DNA helicase IV